MVEMDKVIERNERELKRELVKKFRQNVQLFNLS